MPKSRLLALAASAMLAGAIVPVGAGSAMQATPAAIPAETGAITAIVVAATNDPLRAPGSDGVDHLEYDLLVINAFDAPVTLSAIEVLAADGETLLRLEGDALAEATQSLFGGGPSAEIAASGTVGVVMDVTVPRGRVVQRLTHRVTYTVADDAPFRSILGAYEVDGPELPVSPREPVVLAQPLRGGGWLAVNGCCSPAANHRTGRFAVGGARIVKPEVFALDLVRLRDGKPFDGDGARPEQWYGYGAEVLAVADGTVVATRDGMPDEAPGQPPQNLHQTEDYGGNHVTLEIAPGVYAFYAHFQPGSVAVKRGDRVTAGQVLGLLGNTGNTSGPHLHFGLIDGIEPLTATSLPMVFDRWTLEGAVPPEAFSSETMPDLAPQGTPEAQTATLPLFRDVADFG